MYYYTKNKTDLMILLTIKIIMNFNPTYFDKPKSPNNTTCIDKTVCINKTVFNKLCYLRSQLDNIHHYKWRLIRSIISNYEYIGCKSYLFDEINDIKPISRAYFKLWEILKNNERTFGFMKKDKMRISCLAEAPGGFIQCLINYRKGKQDNITGISLKDGENNKIDWVVSNPNIKLLFGNQKKEHDGNLYNPDILNYYCKYYKKRGADLVTADGGINLQKDEENYKGLYHIQLFLAEVYIALKILKKNGIFILKIYEFCFKPMLDILKILELNFDCVDIYKPKLSREMNSEKYVICSGYKKCSDETLDNLMNIIKHLWVNKNLLVGNILDGQKHNSKLTYSSDKFIMYQINKLDFGLKYTNYRIKDLKVILNSKYLKKTDNANKWIKKYI